MNPTIQPGMHPDAETLTAFAEQLLPAVEREEILAHVSACGRCREVLFLAQLAVEEDHATPAGLEAKEGSKPRSSWFNWRWAWIPAAACAGLVGVAVVQHYRQRTAETQTAANVSPTDALRTTEPPKGVGQDTVRRDEPKTAEVTNAKSSPVIAKQEVAPKSQELNAAKRFEEKRLADQKDVALATPLPVGQAPGLAGGSIHGTMAGRARASAIGGPSAANQFQQQNMANQQNELRQSSGAQVDAASSTVSADAAQKTESETVTVNAQSVAPAAMAAAPPQAPARSTSIPTTGQSYSSSQGYIAGMMKKQKASLPSGLDTLSVVSSASRTIALDTKGALFLSEDGGKHWKPVRTQWKGRALLLRSLTATEEDRDLNAPKMSPTAKFELVTDNLQTWLSADGDIWTLQALPGK